MKTRRNIGIIAHIDAGKTTLTERFLYYTEREHRMGEVHDGTAKMDWQEEEQERGITITSAATTFPWRDARITLIDTPGHVDFTAEVERSLRVLDGAVGVFSGVEGVEAQSETVWRQADRYGVPRLVFINKLDRVGSDYFRVLEEIRTRLGAQTLPMVIPIGQEGTFEGVIDLIERRELRFDEASLGMKVVPSDIAPERREMAELWRAETIERVAEGSDEIMHYYLAGEDPPIPELRRAIRAGTLARRWVPAWGGAAFRNKGVQPVLDGVVEYLPAPEDIPEIPAHDPKTDAEIVLECGEEKPFAALLFKVHADSHGELCYLRLYSGKLAKSEVCTNPRGGKKERIASLYRMHANERAALDSAVAGDIVAVTGLRFSGTGDTLCDPAHPVSIEPPKFPETVISMAVEPRGAADRDRLLEQLGRLVREDPTFKMEVHPETGQIIMSGMGELHLEVKRNRLLRDFKVDANIGTPRVSYRQTFARGARRRARFQRMLGGKEHLGEVELEIEPEPKQPGVLVAWGERGLLPKILAPKLEEAARDCAASGGERGFPYIQIQLRLSVPAFTVDMTEVGLQLAVKQAFDEIEKESQPVLLEPLMRFQIVTPEEYFGLIHQDLSRRRATIQHVEKLGGLQRIEGEVPLSEVFGYTTDLRSIAQGRASLSLEPVGYAPAPEKVAERFRF